MQTLEALRGKIGSIEDLQAVVRTMKALAMVNIRPPLVEQILLFHHQSRSNTTHQPTALHLLPLDPVWLAELERKPWDSSSLPMLTMPWRAMFSKLVRLYLFVSLYRAVVESLASENASRLASMQAAEKNIEDRLLELNADYRQQRQNSITGELLDIVAGFEALNTMR
ncbi:MAG: F0F1 ATP synthase subunit gamma [Cyanobacteriota bacterium]